MTKENKYFKVEAADDCVWFTDKRKVSPVPFHMTKEQANELGEMLVEQKPDSRFTKENKEKLLKLIEGKGVSKLDAYDITEYVFNNVLAGV